MNSNISWLAMLAVFSGLSVNLILQFGIGLEQITVNSQFHKKKILPGLGILVVTVLLLWLVFTLIRSMLFTGLLEYVLLFPASYLIYSMLSVSLDYCRNRFISGKTEMEESLSGSLLTGGIMSGAALFVTLNIAGNFRETLVLSLGFAAGIWLAVAITGEIRLRSGMEAVPRFLRGGPLALIAMGLLSLVFTSAALMLYQVLGAK